MKHKFSIIGIVLTVTVCLLAVGFLSAYTKTGPMSKITVMAAGVPDSYGNEILSFNVCQNTTGFWGTISYVDYTTFTNGTTLSIPANQKTIIEIVVRINRTLLSADSSAQAKAQTRVYLTISGVISSTLLTIKTAAGPYTSWWYVYFYYPASYDSPTSVWTPATDTTYTVTIQYQAYY